MGRLHLVIHFSVIKNKNIFKASKDASNLNKREIVNFSETLVEN